MNHGATPVLYGDDLASGERGGRAGYLEHNVALVCGSEAATVVNNCAAALVLTLDLSFRPPDSPLPAIHHADKSFDGDVAFAGDGKVIVAGRGMVRVNPDGSLDSTFALRPDSERFIESVLIQADGRILIGGLFGLLRLNPDGTRDSTFPELFQGSFVRDRKLTRHENPVPLPSGSSMLLVKSGAGKVSGDRVGAERDAHPPQRQARRLNLVRLGPESV